MAYFVYVLRSLKDQKLYIGQTSDLERRIKRHNNGRVKSTSRRRPFQIIYKKEFSTRNDAVKYEYYLKSPEGGSEFKRIFLNKIYVK